MGYGGIMNKVKALLIDIETSPLLAYVWGLWDNNVPLNMLKADWSILSFSAKWLGDSADKIIYMDQRNAKQLDNDNKLLKKVWKLLNEADVIISQNGKRFDMKKLNAKFIEKGFKPYSSVKHIDTLVLAKKHFAFTSNKLEYMTNKLCVKYKKLKHAKFSGFELWKECLAGNVEAWNEMEKYNKYDVLSLEELYNKLIPWDTSVNFNLYHDETNYICKCGSIEFKRNGWFYKEAGKYQRYACKNCGHESKSKINMFSKTKRASLRS